MLNLHSRVGGIDLQKLFPTATLSANDIPGNSLTLIQSCCVNADQVQPGDLYVALETPAGDGHDQVGLAVSRGASAVLGERFVVTSVPLILVKDSRQAYGEVCQSLMGSPSRALQAIGITGTSGKTTTAHLLHNILQTAGKATGMFSSLTHDDGLFATRGDDDMPDPARLAKGMAEMVANGCSHALIEASSEGLAQHRLAGVELDAVMLTNLHCDHLDYHGNVKNYHQSKKRILDRLKPSGFAVINADDLRCRRLLDSLDVPTITSGIHRDAEVRGQVIERFASEQTWMLHASDQSVVVRTPMVGEHSIANCLLAAAGALVLGVDLADVVRGLETAPQLPGRLERIECGQPFNVFVDRAASPHQLGSTLAALRHTCRGRLICVFGGINGDHASVARMGHMLEKRTDRAVLAGIGSSIEASRELAHSLLDGFDRPAKADVIPNRAFAIRTAMEQAREGDCVLICGLGEAPIHRTKSGHFVTDAELARHWLYRNAQQWSAPAATAAPITFHIDQYRSAHLN
jgi:UDP-N-acetylmuramoyl-L-alanyl-D-glutamate--2,6-diaminopimelate ligase